MTKILRNTILPIILACTLIITALSLSACNNTNTRVDLQNSNILVTYFSATGNTKQVAEYIQDILDADIIEITPEIPYTSNDLNWNDPDSRVSQEHNDSSIRPAITTTIPSISQYDVIFLGYPIWWGEAPNIIYTFLEQFGDNLGNKTIIPFCTSSSSGMGSSATHLHSLVNNTAVWLAGERFSTSPSRSIVENWIDSISL